MSIDLEARLRDELVADAARCQLPRPEWDDSIDVSVGGPPQSARIGSRRVLAAAAAVALLLGGLVIAARPGGEPAPPAFQPPGEEFPLTVVGLDALPEYNNGPDGEPGRELASPGSDAAVVVPGRDTWIVPFRSPFYDSFAGTVLEYACQYEFQSDTGSSGGCGPQRLVVDFGPWSDASGTDTHVGWTNVPVGAAFVGYVGSDGVQRWQVPALGMAFFPETGASGTMTAFAVDGSVLQVVDREAVNRSITDVYGPLPIAPDMDSLSAEQRTELWVLTKDVTRACLERGGAEYPYGSMFPTLPADAPPTTWDDCVAEAKAAVDTQFAAWGGSLVPQVIP